jgi:hypothetical protein
MNKKSLEKLETELATLTARREAIATDLASATADAQAAQAAMISGTGTAASLSAAKANRDALSEAHSAISVKIDAAQAEFESAQKATEKESALKATADALGEYDAATLAFQNALREFMASGNGEAVMRAASCVRRCENDELRADLRSRVKPGALEYPRACGNAEIIVGQILDHISGTQYVTSDVPAGKVVEYADEFPPPVAQLSKAGIS